MSGLPGVRYAKEVIKEKKSFIKEEKLAQGLLTTKQKHINQKDMLVSICTWRENIREQLLSESKDCAQLRKGLNCTVQ